MMTAISLPGLACLRTDLLLVLLAAEVPAVILKWPVGSALAQRGGGQTVDQVAQDLLVD